jgi:hypothetical protein
VSDDLKAGLIVAAAFLILIPTLIWFVRSAKRRAGGMVVAWSLFFGWERMFEGATDHTELAQDPEWQQQPGAAGGKDPT